jgi:molecular chaperone DnaK (HSP70)
MKMGIDLGTSYSSVAIEIDGRIEMIKVATGASAFGDSFSMPTAVYVDNGHILLGQAAINKRKISPSCFKSEFKRDLGTSTPYVLGEEEYLPEQLYTEVFLYFKKQACEQTGEKIEEVYITHPANYGNNKKRLIEKAANNAGLLNVVLVDEPTAAAAGYSQKSRISDGDILLVYDLGGGTFDVAIIKKTSRGYMHLTEPLGISQCGGIDFDRVIFDDIMQKIRQKGEFDTDKLFREKR